MRILDLQFEFPLLSQKPSSRRCFSHDIFPLHPSRLSSDHHHFPRIATDFITLLH
ncbi:hypothetical protein HanIR_Chr01g0017511 [Helianthus annuus]|nr:hypothetical protein HanIR_Chr01g0017511 [Helianthus annuus]